LLFKTPADGLKKFAFISPQAWTIFNVKKLRNVKMNIEQLSYLTIKQLIRCSPIFQSLYQSC